MKRYFTPGCEAMVHNAEMVRTFAEQLEKTFGIEFYEKCCMKHTHSDKHIITMCPGCEPRFKKHPGVSTMTLWQLLAESDFPLPDHTGKVMTIHDSCDIRGDNNVYNSVRTVLNRMNIKVIEPPHTKEKSICCGASVQKEFRQEVSARRVNEIATDEVVVYCVACFYYLKKAGKNTFHLLDLITGSATDYSDISLNKFYAKLSKYFKTEIFS